MRAAHRGHALFDGTTAQPSPVALPDIGKAFTASQTALDLVAVGYSLGLVAARLVGGLCSDL